MCIEKYFSNQNITVIRRIIMDKNELLMDYANAIYQNINAGTQSIEDILPKIEDDSFKKVVAEIQSDYYALKKECELFAKSEDIKGIKGNPVIINKQGLFEVKGVHIRSLLTDHDKEGGRLRGQNLVFQYRLDGVEVCHLGDIGEECNAMLAEALVPTNVLLIPVGGNYTINAEEAKEYVDKLMPDVVIPMHFKTEDCSLDIDGLDDFLDLFDKDEIVYLDSDTVEFDRFDFDGESTKVYVFKSQQ